MYRRNQINRSLIFFSASLFIIAAIIFFLLTGCATKTEIEPTQRAHTTPPADEVAVAKTNGVRIIAEHGEWPGNEEILRRVTPLKVTIENHSGNLLRIRYNEFSLKSPLGTEYAALPVYGVAGNPDTSTVTDYYSIVAAPVFEYSRFYVAPYFSEIYPTIPIFRQPFLYDPAYDARYTTRWRATEMPTKEMLETVLPPGVLEPGGRVSGFLFFERIDERERRLRFTAEFIDAVSGESFGTISIPFKVSQELILDF